MKILRFLMFAALLAAFTVPANADAARAAYKRGVQAEKYNKFDEAFQAYKEAYQSKPRDAEYLAAYSRMHFYAAAEHVRAGQALRDSGKLQEALVEYQKAAAIDATNVMAQQEIRQVTELLKKQEANKEAAPETRLESPLVKMAEQAAGPVELQFTSSSPITLRLSENADVAYKIVGKLAGINVLFDPEFKAQRLSVELNDVTPREALNMVALQSKTFWQPVSANTIMVAADTPGKRKDRQDNIMTTFYLRNVSAPTDLQDAANTVKSILDLSRVQLIPRQNAIIMRGTADQLVLAQKLLTDIDKPQPECVIDIVVMQIRRDKVRTLGTNLPTSASVALVPGGGLGATGGGSFTINSLRNINATNFQVSIPGATLTALMDDSNTKIIQNPEIRALDNQKATLKIGDRVPIATGSFSGGGGASVSPLVNTQFQYLDVGVNIDITPHVHANREVTLQMTLEISSVTGSQNLGGVTQPIIGQRRIEHEMRLKDGDVNLVGGILEDSETQSLSGYPGLLKIPVLKYLFGQENKEVRENEIVFAITPHIVRSQDLDEQNLRPIDIGTGSLVEMRHPADPSSSATAKALPKVPAGGVAPKAARVGTSPAVPAPSPTAAPAVVTPPAQQLSSNSAAGNPISANSITVNRSPSSATTDALKADGAGEGCPKGATPDHPIGCYLNGGWRVDVGDGRGYQAPPASGSTGASTGQPLNKGVTGTSSPQDPKATATAGPLV